MKQNNVKSVYLSYIDSDNVLPGSFTYVFTATVNTNDGLYYNQDISFYVDDKLYITKAATNSVLSINIRKNQNYITDSIYAVANNVKSNILYLSNL